MSTITSQTYKVLLFDVYETLLDMQNIKRKVNTLLDSKRAYMHWLNMLLQNSLVDNTTGDFHNFISIAQASLQMAGKDFGKTISSEEADGVIHQLGHLPVHEGVSQSLSRLSDEGFRLAALTNAPKDIIITRMNRTGLISYFDKIITADEVKKYKPSVEVYNWAIQKLQVKKEEVLYVSAHGWDVMGAMHAGLQTVYLDQSEMLYYPLAEKPDFTFRNFQKFVQACTNGEAGDDDI